MIWIKNDITMTLKGYLKPSPNAGKLARAIAGLETAGVSPDDILIGENVLEVLDGMQTGDTLVLYSLRNCGGVRGVAELLKAAAGQGITVRALEEDIDTSVPPADWVSAAGLFQRMEWSHRSERSRTGLRAAMAGEHHRAEHLKAERFKQGLCEALAAYYTTGRSVHEISLQTGIDPGILYRCINKNDLPSRRDIAGDPSRAPFSGGRLLHIRIGNERIKVSPVISKGRNGTGKRKP